jgi:hypothetical protein
MTTALKPSLTAYAAGTSAAVAAELARQDDNERLVAETDPAPAAEPAAAAHRHGPAGTEPPSVTDVIAAARATGDAKLTAQADRAQAVFDVLVAMLGAHQALTAAQNDVAWLEAQLDAAKAKVRGIKQGKTTPKPQAAPAGAPAHRTADGPKVDPKRVRAWAAAHGIACNSQGIVRRDVVDAYLAAMRAEGALA